MLNRFIIMATLFLVLFINNVIGAQNQQELIEHKHKGGGIKFGGIHGTILIICWCVAADSLFYFRMIFYVVAVISARFFKSKFYFIEFHILLFSVIAVMTFLWSFLLLCQSKVRTKLQDDNKNYKYHYYLGIILVPLTFLKLVTGVICYFQIKRKMTVISKYYRYVQYIHKIGGYLIIIIGKIIAVTGACISSPGYIAYIILYIIILITYILFEIYCRTQKVIWVKRFESLWNWFITKLFCPKQLILKHPEYNQIISELKTQSSLNLAEKYPNLIFVLYRDYLIDLTGVIHPGGTFMNYQVRGREISRFINGSYNLETYYGNSMHQHSKFVEQQIKRHIVGKIDTNHLNLVKKNELPLPPTAKYIDLENSNLTPLLDNDDSSTWELVKRTQLLPEIMIIEFSSNKHTILNYLPGVQWLGRHMAITPKNNPFKERIYTSAIFATPNNLSTRNQLIELYDKKINNQDIDNYTFDLKPTSQTYPMIIKKYQGKNPLSCFLHNSTETQYTLTGPFGQGLGLNNSDNKTYYFILGGTTMPILDLTYILLQKCIYTVIQDKFGKEEAEKFNPYQQNFNKIFGPNFHVKVLLTLKNVDSFIGREMCAKLLEICHQNQINIFDMIVRFSTLNEEEQTTISYIKHLKLQKARFNKQFFQEAIKVDYNFGKVYICGPQLFIQDAYAALSGYVEKNKIIIF